MTKIIGEGDAVTPLRRQDQLQWVEVPEREVLAQEVEEFSRGQN